MRVREPEPGTLPRWITSPLVADWLSRDELRPRSDRSWQLDRMAALSRYNGALEVWATSRGVDWVPLSQGYPRFPEEAPGVDPDDGGPPADVLAGLLGRVGR